MYVLLHEKYISETKICITHTLVPICIDTSILQKGYQSVYFQHKQKY